MSFRYLLIGQSFSLIGGERRRGHFARARIMQTKELVQAALAHPSTPIEDL
jgi:hypothetical protein